MAEHKYAFNGYNSEIMARAVGRNLAISTKQTIEICNLLRRKDLQTAKELMEATITKKKAVPFRRFTNGVGHKKGIAAGRYPVKAATEVLKLLNSVEVNAQNKGLNTGSLAINHICAQQAFRPMHYGRQARRMTKRSHVEIVVSEVAKKDKNAKATKSTKTPVKESKTMTQVATPASTQVAKPELKSQDTQKTEDKK